MDFRLLGPLEALDRGQPLPVGGPKVRALLAMLLLQADQTVGIQQLIDGLWGERAPTSSRQALHFLVHRLRRALAGRDLDGPNGSGLVTADAGYQLQIGTDELDVARFERLLAEARTDRAGGAVSEARAKLAEALALWRGDALADLLDAPFAPIAATRLEELRAAAQAERIQLELELGRHSGLVAELEALVHAHPLREQLRAQLALALYRSGRQADALAVCRDARTTMVEELGIEPGPDLARLERAILTQDAALELPGPAPAPPPPPKPERPAASAPPRAPERREERKVVTVLVAMLRESGPLRLDPEDAQARHEAARARLVAVAQRFGGTAMAAVGGTTLAVFGAPLAHDDDPERAVRAALQLRAAQGPDEADLALRIGIETGQALVTLHGPAGSEPRAVTAITGPVMDQAAALAASAPPGGAVVGAGTERATRRTIGYRPYPATDRKSWEALEPHGRTGATAAPVSRSPLVEREHEVTMVAGLLARARREREPQLVTLAGGPGIGKSRLVQELGELVEADPDLVTWRQGRCLPYGEGVTFWALGEIVKAHAGILDSDPAEQADAKLARAADDALAGEPEQAAWVAQHLRALITAEPGPSATLELAGPGRGAFAAWRRLIGAIATERPLVLVFEDLHWADDGLLDFIDELPDRVGDVPLLVVCTARPELLARRPTWGGGKRNATTISLLPLSPDGTVRLLGALLETATLPEATELSVVERAGGNPLFIEEYVHMLHDQGFNQGAQLGAGAGTSVAVPESVQQLITARLDTLDPADKALLADAAVVGQQGWVGALAAVSGRPRTEVTEWLHRVEQRDLLRRARPTSVSGETEYAFRHVLVRDVAYGQLPRAARAERHKRAATWLEELGTDRADDRAELLAHHWGEALRLATAAGEPAGYLEELTERARVALREVGDRAAALGANRRAADFYAEALALWPEGDDARAELLLTLGRAQLVSQNAGYETLVAARDALLAQGRADRAAEAELYLFNLAWRNGRPAERAERRERLLAMVRDQPPSPSRGIVLAAMARELTIANLPAALDVASQAITNARHLGQRWLEAGALGALGMAKVRQLGDAGGLEDLARSIKILDEQQLPDQLIVHRINYAAELERLGDLAAGFASQAAARATVTRYEGCTSPFIDTFLRGLSVKEHYWTGSWEQAERIATELLDPAGETAQHYMASVVRVFRGRIRLARNLPDEAERDAAAGLDLARSVGDPQLVEAALAFRARVLASFGHHAAAGALLDELLAGLGGRLLDQNLGIDLPLTMVELGLPAERLTSLGLLPSRWLDAALGLLAGERGAADCYAEIGARPDEAAARLLAARRLLAAGRRAEAVAEATAARAFAAEVGACGFVRDAQEVLTGARAPSTATSQRPSRSR